MTILENAKKGFQDSWIFKFLGEHTFNPLLKESMSFTCAHLALSLVKILKLSINAPGEIQAWHYPTLEELSTPNLMDSHLEPSSMEDEKNIPRITFGMVSDSGGFTAMYEL